MLRSIGIRKFVLEKAMLAYAVFIMLFLAGFGVGLYTMWLHTEPVLFQWMESARAWEYMARCNQADADTYRMQLENSRYMLDRFEFYYDELVAGNGALEEVELLVCHEVTGKFTD
jgi:hypothetical protein